MLIRRTAQLLIALCLAAPFVTFTRAVADDWDAPGPLGIAPLDEAEAPRPQRRTKVISTLADSDLAARLQQMPELTGNLPRVDLAATTLSDEPPLALAHDSADRIPRLPVTDDSLFADHVADEVRLTSAVKRAPRQAAAVRKIAKQEEVPAEELAAETVISDSGTSGATSDNGCATHGNSCTTDGGACDSGGGCRQCGSKKLLGHKLCCGACMGSLGQSVGWASCDCNGSYKFPVPPLYTYHWPGMYSAQLMTDYHSPWRFPPLRPYRDEPVRAGEPNERARPGLEKIALVKPPSLKGDGASPRAAGDAESTSRKLERIYNVR